MVAVCSVCHRFLYHGQWRDKISAYVHYPIHELNMSPYVVGDQQPKNYHLYAITVSIQWCVLFKNHYYLFSFRITQGHCMEATVRCQLQYTNGDNMWLCMILLFQIRHAVDIRTTETSSINLMTKKFMRLALINYRSAFRQPASCSLTLLWCFLVQTAAGYVLFYSSVDFTPPKFGT